MLRSGPQSSVYSGKFPQIGQKTRVATNPSMALQAKSFSSVITTEPQPVHCGLTEEGRKRWEVKKWREEREREGWGGEKDRFHEWEAPKVPRGIVVYNVVLYICLQQRVRQMDEAGETERWRGVACRVLSSQQCSNCISLCSILVIIGQTHAHTNCSLILLSLSCAVKASHQQRGEGWGGGGVKNK